VAAAPAAQNTDLPNEVPVISTAQISAPGSPPPAPTPLPATPAPMTYATLFHEIGYQYDLNWRVLAAQAYVESGFDTLALGANGDLGLMQIHPATWREWAPTVAVNDPFDGYSNVLVAAAYLDYLRGVLSKRGQPEIEWAFVAYNWGIDKVLQHLDSGQGWQELASARQQYAIEVLQLAETIPVGNKE
jgi:soluble lytic murein transglycosylase-like protein